MASRLIQLAPPYKGGPVMEDNAVIPRTARRCPSSTTSCATRITNIISELGPTKQQPKGPFGDVIESFADGLAGKGKQINKTLNGLSER